SDAAAAPAQDAPRAALGGIFSAHSVSVLLSFPPAARRVAARDSRLPARRRSDRLSHLRIHPSFFANRAAHSRLRAPHGADRRRGLFGARRYFSHGHRREYFLQ